MPAQHRMSDDDHETFDLNVSDTSTSDGGVQSEVAAPAAPTALVENTAATLLGPLAPLLPSATGRSNRAHDIDYFFIRGSRTNGSLTICKQCSQKQISNPTAVFPTFRFKPTTSNSSLRKHLKSQHEEEYTRICSSNGWKNQLPGIHEQSGPTMKKVNRETYTEDSFLEKIVNWIVADDQSIRAIESVELRDLLLLLREDIDDDDIPRRDKIHDAILQAWKRYYLSLKQDLKAALGKISYTSDIWSSDNLTSYIAITAHWMCKDESGHLQLKNALISFQRVWGKHTASNLARVVLQLLDRAGTTTNSGHFTLDNIGTNDKMMEELEKLFAEREIPFNAKEQRIMCIPHVINIIVQHVITKMSSSLPPEGDEDDDAEENEGNAVEDPIHRCRKIIAKIRSSGQRREKFESWIKTGNDNGWFKVNGKVITMPHKQLLRDVRTRWDSTYLMLRRFIEMRPAIDSFMKSPDSDLEALLLSEKDWEVLINFGLVLKYPHEVQEMLAGEEMPVLAGVIPVFETFMTKWETLLKKKKSLKPYIEEGLKWAKKYYVRMDNTDAYIVGMFINPSVRVSWIANNWETEWKDTAIHKIKTMMKKYHMSDEKAQTGDDQAEPDPKIDNPWQLYVADIEGDDSDQEDSTYTTSASETIEEEFSTYVASHLKRPGTVQVDPIKFWEANQETFPTIYRIAMDFLPIQASSVPCERVFSSSAETDTKKRNRLKPEFMEALQILKYSLKKKRLSFTEGLVSSEDSLSGVSPSIKGRDLLVEYLRA